MGPSTVKNPMDALSQACSSSIPLKNISCLNESIKLQSRYRGALWSLSPFGGNSAGLTGKYEKRSILDNYGFSLVYI
jgi:hypothetical protein